MSVASTKHTVHRPVVPYTGSIPGGLHPGEIIIVQGAVPQDADRFQLDLSNGSSTRPRSDVALSLSAVFGSAPCVRVSSLAEERWSDVETIPLQPFRRGAPFEALILVLDHAFKVAVNGTHLLEHQHVFPLDRINTFSVTGSVELHNIAYTPSSGIFSESRDLNLPYTRSILRGFRPGQQLSIKGRVSLYPHSFTVNLRCSSSHNVALHLNPRLRSGVFVRNSYLNASWGREEKHLSQLRPLPFLPGEEFEMLLLCQPHQFKMAVNGVHLLDFSHRVQDLTSIDQLEILGDLELSDVRLW